MSVSSKFFLQSACTHHVGQKKELKYLKPCLIPYFLHKRTVQSGLVRPYGRMLLHGEVRKSHGISPNTAIGGPPAHVESALWMSFCLLACYCTWLRFMIPCVAYSCWHPFRLALKVKLNILPNTSPTRNFQLTSPGLISSISGEGYMLHRITSTSSTIRKVPVDLQVRYFTFHILNVNSYLNPHQTNCKCALVVILDKQAGWSFYGKFSPVFEYLSKWCNRHIWNKLFLIVLLTWSLILYIITTALNTRPNKLSTYFRFYSWTVSLVPKRIILPWGPAISLRGPDTSHWSRNTK